MITELECDAILIVRDVVRVAASPDADLSEDGVDERLFAARIEELALRHAEERVARIHLAIACEPR